MKNSGFGRADRHACDFGNLLQGQTLSEKEDGGRPVVVAERLHCLPDRRSIFGRACRRCLLVRLGIGVSAAVALTLADPVSAFAMQDGKRPGRKARRIPQAKPPPADRRPAFLDRFGRLILITQQPPRRPHQPGLPARSQPLTCPPVASANRDEKDLIEYASSVAVHSLTWPVYPGRFQLVLQG